MKEIWKDIIGYDGIYQISNYGRIKSQRYWSGRKYIYKEKLLKPTIANNGYLRVTLRKNKKGKYLNIHKLVAIHFLENKNNYPCINHIDGNKLNNRFDNLEWCTQKHNVNEAYKLGLMKVKKGKDNHRSKKVIQYDLQHNKIKEWDYMNQITQELGFDYTNISKCCNKIYKKSYGYIWEYKEG